jgi:nicotinamide-nucleotide amidase
VSLRAGIVVTGTEVLTGRVSDRNGPWLADQLHELGVDLAYTAIVGDRPDDVEAALRFMAEQGMDIVLTSGGLGPTADDLTAAVVGRFQGREMVLDDALAHRIAEIIEPLMMRWPNLDLEAVRSSTRKQATVPAGATVLGPVGTAPGLKGGALSSALSDATPYRRRMLRLFGIPESEIAETLRAAEREGVSLDRLEITTCLKRGEIEVVTRHEPDAEDAYEAFARVVRERHADTLFSEDGSSVDDQVAALLRGAGAKPDRRAEGVADVAGARAQAHPDALTIATAESCTGGLLAARLTERPGASDYVKGGIVAYSNEVKSAQAGVAAELIERHGAVSAEVAQALADGARSLLGADVGVGVTGIAGPGGGTEEKPVGLVWLSVVAPGEARMTRSVNLPGSRADVRDRATTIAMHMIRRTLSGL